MKQGGASWQSILGTKMFNTCSKDDNKNEFFEPLMARILSYKMSFY